MDKVLAEYDFCGVDEEFVDEIKATCIIFQHMTFAPDANDWKWLCIRGCMVGKPEFDYYIHKVKEGIDVQVMKSGETFNYRFGVTIFTEDGKLCVYPYMNGHLH